MFFEKPGVAREEGYLFQNQCFLTVFLCTVQSERGRHMPLWLELLTQHMYICGIFVPTGQTSTLQLMEKAWILRSRPALGRKWPLLVLHHCTQSRALNLRMKAMPVLRPHHPTKSQWVAGQCRQSCGLWTLRGRAERAEA